MRKIKSALALGLLVAAPAIYAQNIDTKAPVEPGFMVTLNVTNNGSAADTVWIRDYKDTKDSVILKGNQVKYGTYLRLGLKAQEGQTIDSLKVGEKKAVWTGEASDKTILGTLTFTAGKPNLYSLPLGPVKSETNVTVVWKEKAGWNLTFGNTTQTVNSSGAAAVTVSDNGSSASVIEGYYKTKACAAGDKLSNGASDIKTAGTYYVKLSAAETADKKGLDMVIPLVVNNKLALTIGTQPSIAEGLTIKEGQLLYSVPLTAGVCKYEGRVIKGIWAWENPNMVLAKGNNSCKAVFTPDSSAIYNNITSNDITVSALYVATVTVEQSAGGTVTIKDATPDNKYVGTASAYANITATATPATGYKFVSWASPVENTSSTSEEEKFEVAKTREISAAPDGTVIKAVFAKATRKVTFTGSPSGGTVKVLNGNKEIATGAEIPYGTNLTIVATPATKKQVKSVSYTYKATDSEAGTKTEANNFVVGGTEGGSYTVNVEFEDIPNQKVMVNVTAPVNGSITLLDKDNKAVNPNSSVDAGSSLTIVAVPNRGYKLAWLRAGDADVKGDFITVNTEITIAASFVKEEYEVTNLAPEQVEFSNVTFGKSEFETPIKNVTASIKEAYKGTHKLVSLLLNNQAIANGNNDLLVEGDMNFSALVKTLETISIQNEKTTEVVYNGNAQVYTVKTAANLAGFKVTFKDEKGNEVVSPSTVGTYKVIITREADDLYAAYKNDKDYALVIKPGMPGVLDIPFTDKLTETETEATTTVAGEWLSQADFQTKYPNREPATKAGGSSVIYFVPSDDNLGYVKTTSVESSQADQAKTVTINYTANAGDHGTVSVENDFISVAKTYVGLTLTLRAKAEAGYTIDWSKITVSSSGALGNNHTFTVTDNVTVNVTDGAFKQMTAPNPGSGKSITSVYTGRSLAYSVSALGLDANVAWKIQYAKQNANGKAAYTTPDPVDAGTYKIMVSCDNGATYRALAETEIGTLTIEKQKLVANNIQVPNASPVAKGAKLSTSILDTNGKVTDAQGNPVPGQFTWASDIEVQSAGNQTVLFTPSDANNYLVDGLQLSSYVSLKGVPSYLMTVKAVNGNASNLLFTDATGKVVNPSTDKVPAGMKLYVTTTSGTIGDISVVGENASAGSESASGEATKWYCIAGSEAFTVTVTFKSGSEGEGGDTPSEGTAVTGITLNKSTLTLARLKSEKLIATVAPTGATKKDVKWTSTTPDVASVAADGTVKALKVGTATIIATTVDGGFTAMCQVTVDFATALEKILSESLVYGQKGQIVIEPAAPVDVTIVDLTGKIIYNSSINNVERIPAYSGVYVVRLSASGKATTIKVLVR